MPGSVRNSLTPARMASSIIVGSMLAAMTMTPMPGCVRRTIASDGGSADCSRVSMISKSGVLPDNFEAVSGSSDARFETSAGRDRSRSSSRRSVPPTTVASTIVTSANERDEREKRRGFFDRCPVRERNFLSDSSDDRFLRELSAIVPGVQGRRRRRCLRGRTRRCSRPWSRMFHRSNCFRRTRSDRRARWRPGAARNRSDSCRLRCTRRRSS